MRDRIGASTGRTIPKRSTQPLRQCRRLVSLDLTGAISAGTYFSYGQGFISGGNNWYVAPGPGGPATGYAFSTFDGPFGTSGTFVTPPSLFSGADFFIWGESGGTAQVGLPVGYLTGSAIISGMQFDGATIAGLNMTPGTYHYNLPNDTITLNVGTAVNVPEPATLALVGSGLLSLSALRRRRKTKA